jgi:hypothetical protein
MSITLHGKKNLKYMQFFTLLKRGSCGLRSGILRSVKDSFATAVSGQRVCVISKVKLFKK